MDFLLERFEGVRGGVLEQPHGSRDEQPHRCHVTKRTLIRYSPQTFNRSSCIISLLNGKVLAAAGKIEVRFKRDAKSETWDLNLVDDQGLSVTFDHVKLTNVDTITLKDVNGKITAEIE